MLCLIPFCEHDRDKAVDLINWIKKLGGWGKHRLLTIAQPELAIDGIENIGDYERINVKWTGKDASGVNSLFRQAAYWVYMNDRQPWLWNEPDAIWLRGGVLDRLEAEYVTHGKPFMGPMRIAPKGRKHLGGVSVYPPNLTEIGVKMLLADRTPFDLAGADEALPLAHVTPLIAQYHRHPGFKTLAELNPVIDAGAILFHSNHDHSIIRLLGGNNGTIQIPSSKERQDTKENEVLQWPVEMANAPFEETQIVSPDVIKSEAWAVEILKQEAEKSPLHKARLAKRLVAAGVIAETTKKPNRGSRRQPQSAR